VVKVLDSRGRAGAKRNSNRCSTPLDRRRGDAKSAGQGLGLSCAAADRADARSATPVRGHEDGARMLLITLAACETGSQYPISEVPTTMPTRK